MTSGGRFAFLFLLNSLIFLLILLKNGFFLIAHLNEPTFVIPWITYQHLFFFLTAHVFLLLAISAITLNIANLIIDYYPEKEQSILVTAFTLMTFIIFLLNQVHYPQSQYAVLTQSLIPTSLAKILLTVGLSTACCLLVISLKKWQWITLSSCAASLLIFTLWHTPLIQNPNMKPNIILIGIDSLRLNEMSQAPTIKRYLKTGQHFTNAITPLARTYPAWMSILTGLYPIHHGAQFNLLEPYSQSHKQSLATQLEGIGYQTVFATDENRFSTIDKKMGFQALVGPKIGATDFMVGKLNDIPLFNILSQTVIAKYLFPYSYINRASYIHYKPKTFRQALLHSLDNLNPNKPLFLATHLTLTHWPLLYAQSPAIDARLSDNQKTLFSLYPNALKAVDRQFSKLIDGLKKRQLLQHAILVILSDHGDASFNQKNRLTWLDNYQQPHTFALKKLLQAQGQKIDYSFGHGTDVLTPDQFHVALSFHFYPQRKPQTFKQLTSLVDLKPTLLDYLGLKDKWSDGLSLKSLIDSGEELNRHVFTETGLNPDIKIYDKKSLASIASYGQRIYKINANNDYLRLKKAAAQSLQKTKQYAVITKDYIFALYPRLRVDTVENTKQALNRYVRVIVDLKSKQWSDNMSSHLAKRANSQKLQQLIENFYGLTHQS